MLQTRVLFGAKILLIGVANMALGQEEPPPPPPRNPVQVRHAGTAPKTDAPAPCNLSMSSLPRFVGVHMAMPYDEVASIYPEIVKDKHFHKTFDKDGSGLFMVQANDVNSPQKEDAVQISLNFRDRAVFIISLVYDSDKWKSIDDAVAEYTRLLGIDQKSWKLFHGESAELACLDFKLGMSSQPGPPRQNSLAIHPLQTTSK